jgi:acetoin utilization deacetylase AcuC-like enzyme
VTNSDLQKCSTPIFYNPKQCYDFGSYSKSPMKPSMLHTRMLNYPGTYIKEDFEPATSHQLSQIHDPRHVVGVLHAQIRNGFNTFCNRKGAEAILMTNGNILAAAQYAVAHPELPGAISLTSGFHHAGWNYSSGFCTFNGLVLAAHLTPGRKLILDFDMHYGDGVVSCLMENPELKSTVTYHHAIRQDGDVWLKGLANKLRALIHSNETPSLIIYQAGADPWEFDPLGGWLTKEQMFLRDRIVFEVAKEFGIPVVWNLAGGYARDYEDTLEIHMNTLAAWSEVHNG